MPIVRFVLVGKHQHRMIFKNVLYSHIFDAYLIFAIHIQHQLLTFETDMTVSKCWLSKTEKKQLLSLCIISGLCRRIFLFHLSESSQLISNCNKISFWAIVSKTVRPMLSCPVCQQGWCIVAKRFDGSRWTWHAGRPWPWPHGLRCGPSSPSSKGHRSVAAKWLHRSSCHLVWR